MPVLVLQEITCEHPDLRITCVRGKLDDLLGVATLEQTLDAFDLLIAHRVQFSCEPEATLVLGELSHSEKNVLAFFFLLDAKIAGWRDYLLSPIFF